MEDKEKDQPQEEEQETVKVYTKEELNELLAYFYEHGGPIMDI